MARDIASRDFTIDVNQSPGRRSEERTDARIKTLQRKAVVLDDAALWRERRRHR